VVEDIEKAIKKEEIKTDINKSKDFPEDLNRPFVVYEIINGCLIVLK